MDERALYLEADEDITSAIDKLRKAPEGPVQIVVPKRSTLLQSVINLKLLKKAADDSGRELVLVTGDKVATDLAARVGLAVAPAVGAKAVMPEAPEADEAPAAEEVIEDDAPAPAAPPVSPAASLGKERPQALRKAAPALTRKGEESLPAAATAAATIENEAAPEPVSEAGKKPPKVPNYSRFNKRLIWGGVLVALIIAYALGMYFFTTAKVTLYAAASQVSLNTDFAVDPNAASFDPSSSVLPGQAISGSKQLTGTFQATGTKDEGTKAAGTMTVYNSYDSNPHTLVAGTRFQAPDGNIFRTDSDVTVPGATATVVHGAAVLQPGSAQVGVTADQAGDGYNEAPARYSIPALGNDQIYGQGGQMSGGTSKVVKVVQQSDVDAAQKALLSQVKSDEQKDLKSKSKDSQYLLTDSFSQSATAVTSAPDVGSEATSATLSLTVNYTMLAVSKEVLHKFLEAQALDQVGKQNQIYDDGLAAAQINGDGKTDAGLAQFKVSTSAYGGVKIDTAALAKQLQGKRYGEALDIAGKVAGVSQAKVALTPPWATSLPRISGHVTVNVSVAGMKPSP